MGRHTTTAGKVKIGLALNPQTYELLRQMAGGPRAVGALVDELVQAETDRRSTGSEPTTAPPLGSAGCDGDELRNIDKHPPETIRHLDRLNERLRILHEIDRAILAAHSPSEIAEAAAHGILAAIDVAGVSIALWDADEQALMLLAVAGVNIPAIRPGIWLPAQDGYYQALAQRVEPLVVEDMANECETSPECQAALALDIHAFVVIPLLVEGRPIGHVSVARFQPGRLPDHDLAVVQQVADSLAVAMHNARLNAEIQDRRSELQALS
ncbi:MAG TPA: GAF domain-containing protein, partial [Anaerolineae bacterium]